MTDKLYSFGGVKIRVVSDADIPDSPKQRLFYSRGEPDYTIRVNVANRLPVVSGECSRVFHCDEQGLGDYCAASYAPGEAVLNFKYSFERSMHMVRVFECADLFGILLSYGAFVLHASYISVGGRAILFTAPSQTGKSTQARLWEEYRGAHTVNGDRALIRCINGVFCACGICFSGSSAVCEDSILPLCAVAVLRQAGEDTVQRLSGVALLKALVSQCAYRTDDPVQVGALFSAVSSLSASVPVLLLSCAPTVGAVEALEKYIKVNAE